MVIDFIEVQFVAGYAHHHSGDQTHGEILGSGVLIDGQRSD